VTGGWITQGDRSRWQQQAAETPAAGGTAVYLHARGVLSGVSVSVTATVFGEEEDGR
jgi:hypothetical protein